MSMQFEEVLLSLIHKNKIKQFLSQFQKISIQSLQTGTFFSPFKFFENNYKNIKIFFFLFQLFAKDF
jgi:hypothetical protein